MDVAGGFVGRFGFRHCGMKSKGLVAFGTRCRDLWLSVSMRCGDGDRIRPHAVDCVHSVSGEVSGKQQGEGINVRSIFCRFPRGDMTLVVWKTLNCV